MPCPKTLLDPKMAEHSVKERRADKDLARAVALEVIAEHGIDCAPVDPLAIAE